MVGVAVIPSLLLLHAIITSAEDGLGVSSTRYCEVEAMRVGTRLVDIYNSYSSNSDWRDSYYCDYMTTHLGFDKTLTEGLIAGRTSEGKFAADLRSSGGWTNYTDTLKSSYWALKDQWLYLHGDSTSRQIFEVMLKSYTGKHEHTYFP